MWVTQVLCFWGWFPTHFQHLFAIDSHRYTDIYISYNIYISYHIISYHINIYIISYHIISYHIISYHIIYMYISNHDFYIIDHLASHFPTDNLSFGPLTSPEVLRPPSADLRPYSMLFDWLVDNPKNPSINRVPGLMPWSKLMIPKCSMYANIYPPDVTQFW